MYVMGITWTGPESRDTLRDSYNRPRHGPGVHPWDLWRSDRVRVPRLSGIPSWSASRPSPCSSRLRRWPHRLANNRWSRRQARPERTLFERVETCGAAKATPRESSVLVDYPLTTSCFLVKSGSISTPEPGPVGTLIFPSTTFSDDVLHSNCTFVRKPLNSWWPAALGRADTK